MCDRCGEPAGPWAPSEAEADKAALDNGAIFPTARRENSEHSWLAYFWYCPSCAEGYEGAKEDLKHA